MRKSILLSSMVILVLAFSAFAEVPQLINYQGLLTDSSGAPVVDGGHLVKFIIYDAPAGGTDLWNSGFQNVTTADGLFSYALGSNVSLPDDIFTDTSRYLGITVGVDPEITPRSRLETSPYAYHALRADSAAFSEITAGVTQSFDPGDVITTGFLVLEMTDSINCPSSGYVMASVSAGIGCMHTNGDLDVVFLILTDSTYTVTSDQDNNAWVVSASMPTDTYNDLLHVHKVYPVDAGWNEFNVISSQNDFGGATDNFATSDLTLSLLFIPNAFGTVETGAKSLGNSPLNDLPLKK